MTVPDVDGVRSLFRGLAIPASGLSAQRKRLDVIAMNIANAQTTRTEAGGPYRRRRLELRPSQTPPETWIPGWMQRFGDIRVPDVPEAGTFPAVIVNAYGVDVGSLVEVPGEGALVYEPGHPDADESGYVRYPNVNLIRETVDLMEARRAYEANATVFDAMKSMLRRATEI